MADDLPARRPAVAPEDEEGATETCPVLLVGDLELREAAHLLEELGVAFRWLRGEERPAPGAAPVQVLLVSAPRALAWPAPCEFRSLARTRIAVARDTSRTLEKRLRRLGFEQVVQQPVHPEALRELLRGALHRAPERRRRPRLAAGCDVEWRTAWRRSRGTLLEISAGGCRILAPRGPGRWSRTWVKLPAALAGGRGLTLRGRITRAQTRPQGTADERVLIAVTFDERRAEAHARLAEVLDRLAVGPARLRRRRSEPRPPRPASPRPPHANGSRSAAIGALALETLVAGVAEPACEAAAPAALPQPASTPGSEGPDPLPGASSAPLAEASGKSSLREVLVLDEGADRVLDVLVGRAFSLSELCVEPHPALALGDSVRLALFDPTWREPVMLGATVIRDDGRLGLGLRLQPPNPNVADRLEQLVETLARA